MIRRLTEDIQHFTYNKCQALNADPILQKRTIFLLCLYATYLNQMVLLFYRVVYKTCPTSDSYTLLIYFFLFIYFFVKNYINIGQYLNHYALPAHS
jgi:hypothetical protein